MITCHRNDLRWDTDTVGPAPSSHKRELKQNGVEVLQINCTSLHAACHIVVKPTHETPTHGSALALCSNCIGHAPKVFRLPFE